MKQCQLCGKGSKICGKRKKLRGNYNPTSTARKQPNLQSARDMNGKKIIACTTCIKQMSKAAK